jgi:hypothetical protein
MGLTVIPNIPPQRQYVEGLDGELIDVTGYSPSVGHRSTFNEWAFRTSLTPRPDYLTNVIGLALTLALMALVVVPILWWMS